MIVKLTDNRQFPLLGPFCSNYLSYYNPILFQVPSMSVSLSGIFTQLVGLVSIKIKLKNVTSIAKHSQFCSVIIIKTVKFLPLPLAESQLTELDMFR